MTTVSLGDTFEEGSIIEIPGSELVRILAEHAGLSRYYLSELACLRTRYGVTEHGMREGAVEIKAFGRTFLIRDPQGKQIVTEERAMTPEERDAERERLRALAVQREAHRKKLEEMAASGDAEARKELRLLQAGDAHALDIERAMLSGRVW